MQLFTASSRFSQVPNVANIKAFSALLPPCRGIRRTNNMGLWCFLSCQNNKLTDKHLSCLWFESLWCTCDIIEKIFVAKTSNTYTKWAEIYGRLSIIMCRIFACCSMYFTIPLRPGQYQALGLSFEDRNKRRMFLCTSWSKNVYCVVRK